ncbi:Motile sperm domain-containing protein 2 [Camelus dromedarius]|uniref:Motile sperm domain-containing protein 2 n=1 Tax=Camelus dromedarius TaxID=9838 RepID=A0A5N4C3I7_CAMDR|nr:Motile sperm domain-containing protein 2 [Camelus dromedarius]
MDFVRFIINCFKVYYPKYLSKMVIFDMPWIMNAAFKIVKSWLGPEAVSLLKFTSKSDIQDYVSVEYLPPHMGGTDPFKYSYPPLVDDDFQTPLCENGPIASEDEASSKEDIESDGKETLETISNEEQTALLKKINTTEPTSKAEENEKVDSKMKAFKKPLSVFKGPLLHISPAEELYFGSAESGEKKALIVLTNVTKNIVAFKVRTTAPEKYRVKPSNSSCDPGASIDIVVSPHGGLTVSAQDRFLIMAAEMEQSSGTGPAELTQFWKEVPRNKVMEHRHNRKALLCEEARAEMVSGGFLLEIYSLSESSGYSDVDWTPYSKAHSALENINELDLMEKLNRLLESNRKLEDQVQRCIWFQQLLLSLTVLSLALVISFFYLLYS